MLLQLMSFQEFFKFSEIKFSFKNVICVAYRGVMFDYGKHL